MPSDQKQVAQKPIFFQYQGQGEFRSIRDFSVAEPPEGCETQQLLDWAILSMTMSANMQMSGKMRILEAYCARNPGIATEEWSGQWPPDRNKV